MCFKKDVLWDNNTSHNRSFVLIIPIEVVIKFFLRRLWLFLIIFSHRWSSEMWYLLILLVILLKTIICIHKTIAYLCLLPIQNEIDYIKWCEIHVAFNLFLVFNFRFKVTLPSKKLNFVRRLSNLLPLYTFSTFCNQIYFEFNCVFWNN